MCCCAVLRVRDVTVRCLRRVGDHRTSQREKGNFRSIFASVSRVFKRSLGGLILFKNHPFSYNWLDFVLITLNFFRNLVLSHCVTNVIRFWRQIQWCIKWKVSFRTQKLEKSDKCFFYFKTNCVVIKKQLFPWERAFGLPIHMNVIVQLGQLV